MSEGYEAPTLAGRALVALGAELQAERARRMAAEAEVERLRRMLDAHEWRWDEAQRLLVAGGGDAS